MLQRFIVRFRGSASTTAVVARLHADPDIQVVEETPRMLLVEASEATLIAAVQPGPDVVIIPERHYERPDDRPALAPDPPRRVG